MNPISTSARLAKYFFQLPKNLARLAKHAVRFTKYIATILVACAFSISAFAYTSTYPSMSFTGTHNGWAPGATPMTLYKTNSWHVIVDLQDGDEFKFTPYGDWSVSFGVNGGETNIVANQGSGTYRITFYDDTKDYVIERYTHAIGNQRIYFKTSSFANPKVYIWNAQPSGLYSNTTWPGVSMVHEGNDYYRYIA